jgi:DNA uptake protein ComE-like DNA-binding protein
MGEVMMRCTRFASAVVVAAIAAAAAPSAWAQVGKPVTIVDANIASDKELAALPHLNAALAKGVLERRPFPSITELDAFLSQSLSRQQLTELYGRLFVHLNLNTATPAQILLIPNAGTRMVREFQEYRPYKALAQFHREIGKYVDDKELARLEQYVFVPIDLNTASDADILTIPGLGNRMLGEFKEYRPYKAIDVFRREIGKYVNKQEVARLERYVTIN